MQTVPRNANQGTENECAKHAYTPNANGTQRNKRLPTKPERRHQARGQRAAAKEASHVGNATHLVPDVQVTATAPEEGRNRVGLDIPRREAGAPRRGGTTRNSTTAAKDVQSAARKYYRGTGAASADVRRKIRLE